MFTTTFSQLARVTGGKLNAPAHCSAVSIESVSSDTRTLQQGDLFVALSGAKYDGHNFLEEAIARGAIGVVVSAGLNSTLADGNNVPQVVVGDTLLALQKLAQWNAAQSDSLKIGITGSVGKTTTRHMIQTVLSQEFHGIQSPGNFNNQIGVALSLLQLKEEHEFGVIEFGASSPGEIAELARWTEPEIGVLTNLGPAHLDGFGSVETVIQSKAELIDAVGENGLMILPIETACIPEIKRRLPSRVITTGQLKECDVFAENLSFQQGVLQFSVEQNAYRLQVPGKHFLNAALISLGIARELGLSCQQIQAGFNQFKPLAGRCQLRRMGNWTIIDDCYNANPLSALAGLNAIAELAGVKNRIAVLGDMLGLGERAAHYHRKLGTQIAKSNLDFLLVYGQFANDVAHGALLAGMNGSRIGVFSDLGLLKEILALWLDDECGILVKGSRHMQMERVLTWLEKQAESQLQASSKVEPIRPYRQAG